VLGIALRRGSNAGRITTLVVCGLGVVAGAASALIVAGQQSGDPVAGSLGGQLSNAYPAGWIGTNAGLAVAQMLGYVVVGALVLAAPRAFFRRAAAPASGIEVSGQQPAYGLPYPGSASIPGPYGPSSGSGYGASYAAPSAPPFGAPAAPPFGAPAAPPFGASAALPFGASAAPPFGASAAPPFGASAAGQGQPGYAAPFADSPYARPPGLPADAAFQPDPGGVGRPGAPSSSAEPFITAPSEAANGPAAPPASAPPAASAGSAWAPSTPRGELSGDAGPAATVEPAAEPAERPAEPVKRPPAGSDDEYWSRPSE